MPFVTQLLQTPVIPVEATELHAVFLPNRGGLSAGLVRSGQKALTFYPDPRVPNALVLKLTGLVSQPRQLQLGIQSASEPLALAYYVLSRNGNPISVHAPAGDACADAGAAFVDEPAGATLDALLLDAGRYRQAVGDSLAPMPPAARAAREFFVKLELASNPSVIASPSPVRRAMDLVLPVLRRRARQRAILWNRDKPAVRRPLPTPKPAPIVDSVALLSRLQLGLVDTAFGAGGGYDHGAFESAFEQFANGELRHRVKPAPLTQIGFWITQPSSAFYVFFAEFAFLALECGVDAARWTQLANAMVRTQKLYFDVYAPRSGNDFAFRDYRACNFDRKRVWTPKALAKLRKHVFGASIPDLYAFSAECCAEAMPRFARP